MKFLLSTLSLWVSLTGMLHAQKQTYPRSNFKLIPLATFKTYDLDFDQSFGVAYEQILDKEGKFSWNIPLFIGGHVTPESTPTEGQEFRNVIKINPGIKYHPFGQRRLSYGIGLSLFFLKGKVIETYTFIHPSIYNLEQFGLMLNNALTFNVSKRLNLNAEVAYGPSMYNRFQNTRVSVDNFNTGVISMVHAQLSIGYRFF